VTCGLKPKFLSIDLNLPMEMTKEQLEIVWDNIHRECEWLGTSIIYGHTVRYEKCHCPMVGGATIVGIGESNEYVTPKMVELEIR
jgi:hydrogenase maturation factor